MKSQNRINKTHRPVIIVTGHLKSKKFETYEKKDEEDGKSNKATQS